MVRNVPALVIGIVLAVYWARVIRMAYKARKNTGRGANFVPPEPLGRVIRAVWYPVVALWVAQPFVAALQRHAPAAITPAYSSTVVGWIAAAIAVAALVATLVCWKRMGKSWRMGIDPGETTQLVFTGPWAYVRHPIYALSSLLMTATLVAVPTPLMLATAILHLLFLQWEARREEEYLVARHGEAYINYQRHVGQFLPKSVYPYRAVPKAVPR